MNFKIKFTNNMKQTNAVLPTPTNAWLQDNTKPPITNDELYKIPKIVHQTFITRYLPLNIINIVNHNKRVCSDCEFIFYDDNDCENFIKIILRRKFILLINQLMMYMAL